MDALLVHAQSLAQQTVTPYLPIKGRIAYVVSHGQSYASNSYASNSYAIRTQGIAKALNQQGLETLCFVRPGRPWELGAVSSDLTPEVVVDGVRYIHSRWQQPQGQKAHLEASVACFIKLFKVYRPAAVLAASNWIVGLPAWVAARCLGIPFCYEIRGCDELSNLSNKKSSRQEFCAELLNETFLYQNANELFTLNDQIKAEIVARGADQEKITVIPCSMNKLPHLLSDVIVTNKKNKLDIGEKTKVIVYIGDFNCYEGVDELVKACRQLIKQGRNIKLLLIGDKEEKRRCDESWVIDIGYIAHNKISIYYELADLVVVPFSNIKTSKILIPTPSNIVEALSYNKKVLVSDEIPINEYFACENLYKYCSKNGTGLYEGIVIALKELKLIKEKNIPYYRNYIDFVVRALNKTEYSLICNYSLSLKVAVFSIESYLNGIDKAIEKLMGRKVETEKNYIHASLYFREANLLFIENDILIRGREAFPKSATLANALFWTSNKIGYFDDCNSIINDIKKIYGDTPSKAQKDQLEKLEKTTAYQLSSLSYIGEIVPLENRIKNKIAYVLHTTQPYSTVGYVTRSVGLMQGMKSHGFDVTVISRPGYPLDTIEHLKEADIPLLENINGVEYRRVLNPLRKGLSALEYMRKASFTIEKELRDIKPSIVMAASNHITAIPAYLAAKRLGLPFVYEVRGFWEITRMSSEPEFENSPAYKIQVLLEGGVAKKADLAFTLTEPMKEELIKRGVEKNNIKLLPNSCDPERFRPRTRDVELANKLRVPPEIPVIGYIGSFVAYEGLEDLACACSILKNKGYEFRLLLVGKENAPNGSVGPITEEIIRLAKTYDFENWLILPGRVAHDEVESYYSLIDIAPFPRKPWPVCEMVSPIKPLEALAMEKAVVVSSVRALLEMIQEDKTGLIFNKGSIESLAEQLARLIDDPVLRKSIGQKGRQWVEKNRTWTATGGVALEAFSKLLSN